MYDCCGSIAIGLLLGGAASFIIQTNASHLVGRSLPKRITDNIIIKLINDSVIRLILYIFLLIFFHKLKNFIFF